MSHGTVQLGDIGVTFILTIYDGASVLDVSGASTKQIMFSNPAGTVTTKTASFTTTGTDGKIQWVTTDAQDLASTGTWSIQGKVVIGSATYRTNVTNFAVAANLA